MWEIDGSIYIFSAHPYPKGSDSRPPAPTLSITSSLFCMVTLDEDNQQHHNNNEIIVAQMDGSILIFPVHPYLKSL